MDRVASIAIIVAILCACGVATIVLIDYEENPSKISYSISYDVDGGIILDDTYPTEYTPGESLSLPKAAIEGHIFSGWYLDKEHSNLFHGDTSDLSGDITLYVLWSDSLAGHSVTWSVEGTYKGYGLFDNYSMAGEITNSFLYYDEEKDSYFVQNDSTMTYTYSLGKPRTIINSSTYWGADNIVQEIDRGQETIVTVNGEKLCQKIELILSTGAKETQWIADDWIPYKVEYSSSGSDDSRYGTHMTYTYKSDGIFEVKDDCQITVVQGYGITVGGNEGSYRLGQTVTLTASVEPGTVFKGWYDENMSLISKKTTYQFVVGGSSYIYALNTNEIDYVLESDIELDLDIEGVLSDSVTYTVTNNDTNVTTRDIVGLYAIKDGGPYTILAIDENNVSKIYNVKVNGNVDREFSWEYGKSTYTITLEIDYDDLLYARDLYAVKERQYSNKQNHNASFVTLACEDEHMSQYLVQAVEKIYAEMVSKGVTINDRNVVECILKLTQYIEYQLDEDFNGVSEYWKFPLETLYDMKGDCEDTSILFAALTYAFKEKYEMSYITGFEVIPQHAVGVVKLSGTSQKTNPQGWLYCETCAKNKDATDVGEIPSNFYVSSSKYGTKKVSEYFLEKKYYTDGTCEVIEIS